MIEDNLELSIYYQILTPLWQDLTFYAHMVRGPVEN